MADQDETLADEGFEHETEESDLNEDADGDEAESDEADEGGDALDREEAADETEGESARQVEEAPRRRGASDVIRENKRRAKEAQRLLSDERAQREALQRRLDDLERRQNERRAGETEAEERERVALMTTEERLEHYRQQDRVAHQRELQAVRFEVWNNTDRSEFRQLVREDALVAKVKDKVEAEFERLRREGRPVSREILANLEVGRMIRERQTRAAGKQRRRGEETVRRETVRPSRPRSDAAPQRQRRGNEDTPEARRRRLEGVII